MLYFQELPLEVLDFGERSEWKQILKNRKAKEMDLIELHENWKFREQGQGDWLPATVPGCVHTDLLKNQRIPDPFYRDNEKKLQWIEKKNWEYETTFHLTWPQFKKRQASLVFKGLDTYAGVFLNNYSILNP